MIKPKKAHSIANQNGEYLSSLNEYPKFAKEAGLSIDQLNDSCSDQSHLTSFLYHSPNVSSYGLLILSFLILLFFNME